MSKARVLVADGVRQGAKTIVVESGATRGATIGLDLWLLDANGNQVAVREQDILNSYVTTTPGGGDSSTGDYSPTAWRLIVEIPPNVVALAETATTGIYVITGEGASVTRQITGTEDEITVADGDAVAGNPKIGLADLANSGVGGALLKITRDDKGRLSGTEAATTDDLDEGTENLYYTDDRVIALIGDPDTDLLSIYLAARDAP